MNHAFLQVALGGALGSMARYGVNILAARLSAGFPLGTLTVNIVGCFAMGILAAALAQRGGQHLAPLLLTGMLGGFTTFSAFALDTMTLWERGASFLAVGYVLASVMISLVAVFAGLAAGRGIFA
ncbi:fluoride efflux transporter CrcB [Paracoccus aestuariivivens]|uniref:Fluoride-specific ion channel FluC n=1 Tax=Paracoccus aestuariivivens TaxID=1820333 RepID=A0A6L6JAV1_9RHOB|nr:fluoride efflux transporter CrcB [Paracoccus aestuariivivens]MTH77777.1 fluoride efflux transporter CrcB [Paracoccus aestuariivivens]